MSKRIKVGEDLREQAASQLLAASRLLRIVMLPALRDAGLRPPQAMFLGLLSDVGQLNMSAISRVTNVTLSAATRFIERLENSGAVERVPDSADRRQVMVRLTEEGRGIAEAILEAQGEKLDYALSGIEHEDMEALARILANVNQRLAAQLPSDDILSVILSREGTETR